MKFLNKFLDLLFPEKYSCNLCGKELKSEAPSGLCDECENTLKRNDKNKCEKCSSPITDESHYCLNCQNLTRHFDRAYSVFVYEGGAKRIILNLKLRNEKYLIKTMVHFMFNDFISNNYPADILVSVPMFYKKLKRRGFNQSELLAKSLAEKLNIEYCDCLVKVKDTVGQHELGRTERLTNVSDVFAVTDKHLVNDKAVVIIDDTFTTGSTVSEIAKELYKAGAKSVNVLCFAATKIANLNENIEDELKIEKKFGKRIKKKKAAV